MRQALSPALLLFLAFSPHTDPGVLTYNFATGTYPFDQSTQPYRINGGVASDKPFFFSAPVHAGNYKVTAILGDPNAACTTTIKAESRLMIERAETEPARTRSVSFVVNVRNDKLTLEFTGVRPCLDALEIRPITGIPTIFLAGDSTVTDQPREPTTSWGQMLPRFFKPEVAIATGARVDESLSRIAPGDYLFIEFGHNDKADLKVLIAEARGYAAIPVLITLGDFPQSVRQTAVEEKVPLINLPKMSSAHGAYELAKCVVEGIKANHLPISKSIAGDYQPFDPAHPDSPERS